jgi:hypothetical protein
MAIKGSKGSGKFGGVQQLLADCPDNRHGASPHGVSSLSFLARMPHDTI